MPLAAPVTAAAAPRIAVIRPAPCREDLARQPLYGCKALATERAAASRRARHGFPRVLEFPKFPLDPTDRRPPMSFAFLLTAFIVVASPGTGVLYTLAAALTKGARAGIAAAFGCTLGIVPSICAAIRGLAAVRHTSARAVATLKR